MDEATREEAVDLLHSLGYVYLRHGQPQRAIVLLILAAQEEPMRLPVLRTLAAALIAARLGPQALNVLEQLASLHPPEVTQRIWHVMRARALLLDGREAEARAAFNGS